MIKLGKVNLKGLGNYEDDEKSKGIPRNAIILAAGFGMRMVPINMQTPKALLEVRGEVLIERIIKQLHEVGIKEILVVVGFMNEKFKYLIDKYNVKLIVNENYDKKNNLYSLSLAVDYLSNSYIIPCDLWCRHNPFSRNELYSWYMVSDRRVKESNISVNNKLELLSVPEDENGNDMIGICYLLKEEAEVIRKRVKELCKENKYDNAFWEEALYQNNHMIIKARVVHSSDVTEINTYEQLREIDSDSSNLKSNAIAIIAKVLAVQNDDIVDISVLKKGMTNKSFLFRCKGKKYIMRIPGEGTDQMINRMEEAAVYQKIRGRGICDDIKYINPKNGYKLSAYIEGARSCNPMSIEDVKVCMQKLKKFHEMNLSVAHEFDIFKQIQFYEDLWGKSESIYKDYERTKADVLSLKSYIDSHASEMVLTHIDAVPDNFLIVKNEDKEEIRLIDWEYAGMQDPHVDIAMFCIYSFYNKRQIDKVIEIYFNGDCSDETRVKIYCYIACCGLLWSNWCEYKRSLGVNFGEYSLRQYRYAKEYFKIADSEIEKMEEKSECIL